VLLSSRSRNWRIVRITSIYENDTLTAVVGGLRDIDGAVAECAREEASRGQRRHTGGSNAALFIRGRISVGRVRRCHLRWAYACGRRVRSWLFLGRVQECVLLSGYRRWISALHGVLQPKQRQPHRFAIV
jgi:hypothetical protein